MEENWHLDDPLAKYCENIISSLNNTKVSCFLEASKWKEREIRQHVPSLLVPMILNTVIEYKEDMLVSAHWIQTENGYFTVSTTWESVRKKTQ